MQYVPLATTHPSIPNAAWTKVTAVPGRDRRYLLIINEDPTNTFRIETVQAGAPAPSGATAGFPLGPGTPAGGYFEETYDNLGVSDVYAYQASGGPLTSLAVKEGV